MAKKKELLQMITNLATSLANLQKHVGELQNVIGKQNEVAFHQNKHIDSIRSQLLAAGKIPKKGAKNG